ncbi:MAG: DNA topoisomerase IV [Flavobacteriaceae bacterium]|nr:DNA topoisomerase IV [Flavobacteriaceae bacterium]
MRVILTAFLLVILVSCQTPERDCANFRTGTFEFETLVGTELKKTKFIRNDSIEIDYYDQKIDTFSIRWINDCEYVMKKLRPKNQAEKEPVLFKILTTNGNEYTFEYSMLIKKKNRKRVIKKGTSKKISSEIIN